MDNDTGYNITVVSNNFLINIIEGAITKDTNKIHNLELDGLKQGRAYTVDGDNQGESHTIVLVYNSDKSKVVTMLGSDNGVLVSIANSIKFN
jgi:hypothetical protein